MERRSSIVRGALLGLALAAMASLNLGAAAQSVDPMTALLSEVHALRLAMEQSATVGPRIQLTMARLTLQEQRVTHVSAELDTVRVQLGSLALQMKQSADQMADVERLLAVEPDQAKRAMWEEKQKELKRQVGLQTVVEQQLRSREIDGSQALSTEQARWADLNARLDELERSLGPVR